jgi:aminopeptidase YwaD
MRRSQRHLLRFATVVVLICALGLAAPSQAAAWAESGAAGFDTARAFVASLIAPSAPPAELAPVEFSGSEAKRHVDELAGRIGTRPAGSEGQAEAAAYVRDQLIALGYQTELQPFPISSYEDRGSTVVVRGASDRGVAASTLTYSTAGTVEAEIVDVGLGRDGDFTPSAVRGKIALIRRGETRFSQKVEAVAAAGAIGSIIYNNQPGNFSGSLTAQSRIPAVGVSDADGEALLAESQGGPTVVAVTVDASLEQRTAANVVGTKPGGPETIVVGGHLDSVAAGPGANDNGSGIAVLLEVARVMATRP